MEDLEAFGAPAEVLEATRKKARDTDFEVWPENWPAVEMFLKAASQWVYAGMGSIVGLHYPSLGFLFDTFGTENRKVLFEEIQIIERGALSQYRENENGG